MADNLTFKNILGGASDVLKEISRPGSVAAERQNDLNNLLTLAQAAQPGTPEHDSVVQEIMQHKSFQGLKGQIGTPSTGVFNFEHPSKAYYESRASNNTQDAEYFKLLTVYADLLKANGDPTYDFGDTKVDDTLKSLEAQLGRLRPGSQSSPPPDERWWPPDASGKGKPLTVGETANRADNTAPRLKKLDEATALKILQEANGDKKLAEDMARRRGYAF
jgi:hypothetical protein